MHTRNRVMLKKEGGGRSKGAAKVLSCKETFTQKLNFSFFKIALISPSHSEARFFFSPFHLDFFHYSLFRNKKFMLDEIQHLDCKSFEFVKTQLGVYDLGILYVLPSFFILFQNYGMLEQFIKLKLFISDECTTYFGGR